MKNNYLQRLFIEELNSEGEVNIGGICFLEMKFYLLSILMLIKRSLKIGKQNENKEIS